MELSKIKTILFDVDDVLLHVTDKQGTYLWREHIEEDLGIKNKDIREFFTSPTWEAIIRGKLNSNDALSLFLKSRGYSLPVNRVMEYFHRKNYIPDERAIAVASQIAQRHKTYIATNQDEGRTQYLWQNHFSKLGFAGYFASYEVGTPKPQPEYWQSVLKRTRSKPAEILLIDDSKANTDAAASFGMQAYLYRSFEQANAELFMPLLALRAPMRQAPRD